jgi:hypothetical protein
MTKVGKGFGSVTFCAVKSCIRFRHKILDNSGVQGAFLTVSEANPSYGRHGVNHGQHSNLTTPGKVTSAT